MASTKSDVMAQSVYLAQMEAAKGTCKCRACQILRKGNQLMSAEFLGGTKVAPGGAAGDAESISLEPEEEL